MAVVLTNLQQFELITKSKQKLFYAKTGLTLIKDWRLLIYGTGDGADGVSIDADIATLLGSDEHYTITNILWYTSAVSELFISTKTDEWDELFNRVADESLIIYDSDRNNRASPQHQSNLLLYLGKPSTCKGNLGTIGGAFSTNTSSAPYNILLRGFTTLEPISYAEFQLYFKHN